MENLFVIRHGNYSKENGNLTSFGQDQIGILTNKIKNLSLGTNAVIITSTAPRALQTSDIIRNILSIPDIVREPFIWSHPDDAPQLSYYKDQDPSKVMDIVKKFMHNDVVILVSHYEVVNQFPKFFAKEVWNKDLDFPKLEPGEAIHFDLQNEKFKVLDNSDAMMNSKLEILHNLLIIADPRPSLPPELSDYTDDFEEFKASTASCTDSFDPKYIEALRIFRDKLFRNLSA